MQDDIVEQGARRREAESAMLLVQEAASFAEIGSFARRRLEVPSRAAARYAERAGAERRPRVAARF